MGKPHPVELRLRVVAFVEEGNGHREAARHVRVSPKFVNDMVKLKRATGGLVPKPQGKPGHGKLAGLAGWGIALLTARPGLTLDEIRDELAADQGIKVHRAPIGDWLHRLGLSHKKTLLASETLRPEVAKARHIWRAHRQPFIRDILERLVFIDETSLKTNLVKTTGRAPVGERLIGHAPFGHWIEGPSAIGSRADPRADLHRRPAPRPARRAFGHRQADQPRTLRPLHRNPVDPDPAPRRRACVGKMIPRIIF